MIIIDRSFNKGVFLLLVYSIEDEISLFCYTHYRVLMIKGLFIGECDIENYTAVIRYASEQSPVLRAVPKDMLDKEVASDLRL